MAVISDVETLTRDYPLLAAVNRAANGQHRTVKIGFERSDTLMEVDLER